MKNNYSLRKIIVAFIVLNILAMSLKTEVFAQRIISFDTDKTSHVRQLHTQPDLVPTRNVSTSKNSEITNEYEFQGAYVFDSKYGKRDFDVLSIPEFASMSDPGKPALPVHAENILIPGDADVQVEIVRAESKTLKGYYIQPALTPAVDTEGADEPEFVIDSRVYNSNQFYPAAPVYKKSQQLLRGNKLLTLAVAPVQFNPVSKTLKVYTKIKYKVTYTSDKNFKELQQENSGSYLKMMKNISLNAAQIPAESSAHNNKSTSGAKNYIIITHDNYKAAADTLAKWKSMMGYSTEVISSASWTSTMVKDSIHNRYNTYTPRPDYFVIIGDQGDVPAEIHQAPNGDNFGTDLYYACMDGSGDYVPDMAHGRIPVSSASEAMTVVHKTVSYERNPVSDPTFYNKGTNCAYYDGYEYNGQTYGSRRFLHTSEDVRSYLMNQGYSIERIYETDNNLNPTHYQNGYYSDGQAIPSALLRSNGFQWDGDQTDIASSINDGRFFVFHRDHGYTNAWGWAHPFFVNHPNFNNVQNLSNGRETPVVFSINCHTGDFTRPESFAETFLRHGNGGAVGFVAPSYYSYSGPNDGFAAGLFDAIWSNPGLVPNFGSGGVSNPTLSAHSDIRTMGDVVNQALIRMVETWPGYGDQSQYTHELYHYFGDPAMRIFTQKPSTLMANIKDTVKAFQVNITNASDADAKATLYYNEEIIAQTDLTNGNGILSFQDSIEGYATLTLSGINQKPLQKKVYIDNVIKITPPAKQASDITVEGSKAAKSVSLTISWSSGDGDHRIAKINDQDQFTDPQDGQEYTADNYYHHNGEQVVYQGEGSEVTVYNLDANTVYWFRVYEYNNEDTNTIYTTSEETGNPTNQVDGSSTTLPVELIAFEARQEGESIKVIWKTASEINNNHFILERMHAGQEQFDILGKIAGAGTSNEIRDYAFTDKTPAEGVNYYRLTQVDHDGSCEVFKTIAVDFHSQKQLSITDLHRKGDELVLRLNSVPDGDLSIGVFSVDGRLINRKLVQSDVIDDGRLRVGIPGCNQGYYVLRLLANNQSISRKIAILK